MLDLIIPAYNAHDFIKEALSSIDKQSMKKNILITIIDDGSKNNYNYLISMFPNLNLNIIRLNKNKGVAYARNLGIRKTNNPYLTFLDADDVLIGSNTLEKLYDIIRNDNLIKVVMAKESSKGKKKYNRGHMYGKIFRRDIINKYKIKVPNLKIDEDTGFSFAYLSLIKKEEIFIVDDVLINRRKVNKYSITNSIIDYDYEEYFKAIDYAYKYVLKYKRYDEFKKEIFILYLNVAHVYYNRIINNINLRDKYLKDSYKFYQKYISYLGNIKVTGLTKYNDDEYDLAFDFYELIMSYS